MVIRKIKYLLVIRKGVKMSQSIDKVKIQIPGTMYYLQLAEDRGRWVLSLLLRGDVENEVIVPVFSKNGINKAANELLNNSRLVIDKYPLRNVCDQLFAQAETNLPTAAAQPVEDVIDSLEIDEIKQKIDLIENTIENMVEEMKESVEDVNNSLKSLETERVARLETEFAKNETKGDAEMYTSLIDRLDKIEESVAKTPLDDRVPSLLTAVDALETKISQLEGSTFTGSNPASIGEVQETGAEPVGNLKEELGRLSKAFDFINQRLTTIELKIKSIVPDAPVEGATEATPPTEPSYKPSNAE